MAEKLDRVRMDFVQEIISVDEEGRTVTFRLKPDPRRYEWKVIDGEECLYDRFDKILFPKEAFFESMKQMAGMPIYHQPQEIGDAEKYVQSRQANIARMLDGTVETPTFADKSEEFLESLSLDKSEFVIASVDIVGSTKLATTVEPGKYARLISTVLYELSEVVPKFRGHVLKYTGDGLVAYFPAPSFITMHDLAIDCALTIRRLVHKGLNPVLERRGFPVLDVRIGLDSGEAHVVTMGSAGTKQHKDIIGSVVSMAAKIQGLAKPGEIYMGETTERNLYTLWRQFCEPVALGSDWPYKKPDGDVYAVRRITIPE